MVEVVQVASSQNPGLMAPEGGWNPAGSFSLHKRSIFHTHRDPEEACPNRGF